MPRPPALRPRADGGQAAVELLAAVPFVLLVGALAWQLALAGWTAWMTAHAARVAARADAVGRPVRAAARSALPGSLRSGLEVDRPGSGGVRVRSRVPMLLGWPGPVVVSSTASLGRNR
jgi:pilus assembly protein CpaE